MRPYSVDLRRRIIDALEAGESTIGVARRFAVSDSSVRRYRRQVRERGTLEPRTPPGPVPRIGPEDYDALLAQVQAQPDATLREHCRSWHARTGLWVSLQTMSRKLRELGWTVKKSA